MDRGLLKNIGWLGIANVLVKPVWFVFVTAVLMRQLGAEGYGVLNAALAMAGIVIAFTDLGMGRYTVREVSRDRDTASLLMSNFLGLRLALILAAILTTVVVGWALGYRSVALWAVGMAAIYSAALTMTIFLRGLFEAFEALKAEAVLLIVDKFLVISGGLALLLLIGGAHWTLTGMAAGMVVTAALHVGWLHRRLARLKPALFDTNFIRDHFSKIIPFGLAGLLTVLYFRVDLVMVEAIVGESAAGQYGAAFRILEALLMLPSIVVLSALFPRLSRLEHEGDREGFSQIVRFGMGGLIGASLAVAVTLTLLAPRLIHLLAPDPGFAPAATALTILTWTFPLMCINYLLYALLVTASEERFIWKTLAGVVIFNIITNLLVIPEFGIQGAAATTVASEVILCGFYLVRSIRAIPPRFAS